MGQGEALADGLVEGKRQGHLREILSHWACCKGVTVIPIATDGPLESSTGLGEVAVGTADTVAGRAPAEAILQLDGPTD